VDANKKEMCDIVGRRDWFKVPTEDIYGRSIGSFDYGDGRVAEKSPHLMKFWRDHASYPYKSHDLWFLTEHRRWGMLPAGVDPKALIDQVNREDIWRAAAKELGVADIPTGTSRGKETFFDGKIFDPADPDAYLKSLAISRV
jgi:nitrate/nitrite transport system substrate-binding protein